MVVAVLGCAGSGAQPGTPKTGVTNSMLDGRWESVRAPGDLRTGMTLDLWQVGDSVAGKLVYWAPGDALTDPRQYGAIHGEIAGDRVTVRLPQPAPGAVITLELLRLQLDTLTLDRAMIGGDDGPFTPGMRFARTGSPEKS